MQEQSQQATNPPINPQAMDYFGGQDKVQASINRIMRGMLLDRLGRQGSSYVYALAEGRTRVSGLGDFLIGINRKWRTQEIQAIFRNFKMPYSMEDLLPVFSFREQDKGYWLEQMQARGVIPKNRTEQENLETFIYATLCVELNQSQVSK
jgi:hypothetical protein